MTYRFSYGGSAQGMLLVTETDRYPSGAWAGSARQAFRTVADALTYNRVTVRGAGVRVSGGGFCWSDSGERHVTADVTAWIDVAGKYAGGWVEGAAPQAGDPAGHSTAAIRDFESNIIDVAIQDP